MTFSKPITPLSLVNQTFEQLAEAIVVGDLKPGERIREATLAQKLGVSRGVLREAMQRLEGRKLVSRRSNIGVHVVSLSNADLFEIYEMREALEGMAARLAASSMSQNQIAELNAILNSHEHIENIGSDEHYFKRSNDEDFHFLIARGCGNTRLEKMLCEEVYYQLRLYRYRSSNKPGLATQALEEHREIVAAITARDPDRAEAAMRVHLEHARVNMIWHDEASAAA